MKIKKHFALFVTVLMAGAFINIAALQTVSAAPSPLFKDAKSEACKGSNLSTSSDCGKNAAKNKLEGTIGFIVNLLTTIVGIAAVIILIINGLKFITSNGDSNAISSAKNGIIYAVVGLIIVALAQVIVRYVITGLD